MIKGSSRKSNLPPSSSLKNLKNQYSLFMNASNPGRPQGGPRINQVGQFLLQGIEPLPEGMK